VLVLQQTALVAATLTALLVATLLGVCVKGKVEVSDPISDGVEAEEATYSHPAGRRSRRQPAGRNRSRRTSPAGRL
jgi:hypothetical protein